MNLKLEMTVLGDGFSSAKEFHLTSQAQQLSESPVRGQYHALGCSRPTGFSGFVLVAASTSFLVCGWLVSLAANRWVKRRQGSEQGKTCQVFKLWCPGGLS